MFNPVNRTLISRTLGNRVLVGALLLPALLGSLLLWSLSDRAERSDRVPTAVVNLDKPITMGSGKNEQTIYAGRLLASGLTSPKTDDSTSLGWELTDLDDAQQGLHDGDYYAVLTIPEDFSKTLAGIKDVDAKTAGITVQSNDASSAVVGQISKQVGQIAATRLGHTITATYIEGVLSQTEVMRRQLGQAADGADQLSDGADQLGSGADRLSGGAQQLAGGADELAGGLGRLEGGANQLSGGADRLAGGARRLEGGVGRLASGARRLDRGAGQLASGLQRLKSATGALSGQAGQLGQLDTAQLGQLDQGVAGLAQLAQGLSAACKSTPAVQQALPQLCQAAGQAAGQASALGAGVRQLQALVPALQQIAPLLPQLTGAVDSASAGAGKLAAGTGRLSSGLDRLQGGAGRLSRGASQLSTGADQLAGGIGRAQNGAGRLSTGADQLADGASQLSTGADQLSGGADELAAGLQKGVDQIPPAGDPKKRAQVISDPVDSASSTLNPELDGETLLAPGVLAFVLWLAAFVVFLVRRGIPADRLRAAASPLQLTWSGWWPALTLGALQAALLFAVTLLFGASPSSPVGVALVVLFAVAVFTAINQALVSALGSRRGWIVSIAFATLQVVALGGLLPIDTAPGILQALNQVLPVARAGDALSQLTLGGSVGSVGTDVLVLAIWGLAALGVTIVSAGREQRMTVADVRRELTPA